MENAGAFWGCAFLCRGGERFSISQRLFCMLKSVYKIKFSLFVISSFSKF
jgi:hypothetical protein